MELNLSEGLFGDFWLATDAYVYGYPLVTMEMTRRVFTNVARPEGTHAPMGHSLKCASIPPPHSMTLPHRTPTHSTPRPS